MFRKRFNNQLNNKYQSFIITQITGLLPKKNLVSLFKLYIPVIEKTCQNILIRSTLLNIFIVK